MFQKAAQRFVIRHGAQQFLEVIKPPRRFRAAVLLPHIGIAAFFQKCGRHHDMAFIGEHGAPTRETFQQFTQGSARLGLLDHALFQGKASSDAKRHRFRPRQRMHLPQRGIAKPAFGQVHNAFKRQIIRRLRHDAEIGHGIADFLTLIKPRATHHAIGNAMRDQSFFKGASLKPGADQNGYFTKTLTRTPCGFNAFSHHARFFFAVPDGNNAHLLPIRIGAPGAQGLAQAARIMRDQAGSGGQNGARGTVIGFQPHHLRAGEILLEPQDILNLRPAPGIDGLVIIPDAADIAMRLCQQSQPVILHQIGVLIFIHQDIAKAPLIIGQHIRMVAQDGHHMQQQITEIRRIQRLQPRLIRLINRARAAHGVIRILGSRDAIGRKPAILPALDNRHQPIRGPTLQVNMFGFHYLLQQAHLIIRIQDGEIGIQPDKFRMAAEHARGQRMKGAKPKPLHRLPHHGGNAFAHFPRRLIGEGHRQHLRRKGLPAAEQMRKPRGQHARLARARPGQHQKRAIQSFHRRALLRIEPREVIRLSHWQEPMESAPQIFSPSNQRAPPNCAPERLVPVRSAPVRSAPRKSARNSVARRKSAPFNTVPANTARVRSTLRRVAPVRSALVRSAKLKRASEASTPASVAPTNRPRAKEVSRNVAPVRSRPERSTLSSRQRRQTTPGAGESAQAPKAGPASSSRPSRRGIRGNVITHRI